MGALISRNGTELIIIRLLNSQLFNVILRKSKATPGICDKQTAHHTQCFSFVRNSCVYTITFSGCMCCVAFSRIATNGKERIKTLPSNNRRDSQK